MSLRSALRGPFGGLLLAAATVLLTFALVEGLSSAVIFVVRLLSRDSLVTYSPPYMRYDPELGWASKANVSIPDMYGEGIYLRTNSKGFRGAEDVPEERPRGKLRIICSGDSFTMGHGVADHQTWCHVLETLDGRLETINMGQSGYGLDQAFLAFRRDGAGLEPHVHLFAFIGQDVARMLSSNFLGYDTPALALRDGGLVVENVPVPKRAWYVPPLAGIMPVVRELRTFELVTKVRARLLQKSRAASESESSDMALEIFGELRRMADATDGVLILVYLPERDECLGGWPPGYRMGLHAKNAAARASFTLFDLTAECQGLDAEAVEALFIRKGETDDPHAAGHYSVQGNEWMALAIHRRLTALPVVGERLALLEETASG